MTAEAEAAQEFTPKNVLYLIDVVSASSWYRCNTPGAELASIGHNVRIRDRFNQGDLDWCDVLVPLRLWQPSILDAIRHVHERGGLTVFDVDDDYWNLLTTNPVYESWQAPGVLDSLASVIRACRRVTTTTAPLADRLLRINRDVRVIPNNLPGDAWPGSPKSLEHDAPLVVGWAGGSSHYTDLREVSAVFPHVLERYPQVEVRLVGAHPNWFPERERIVFADPVPIEEYPGLLSGFDIGLAPLADTRFNNSKSDLKVVEYSMIGLPSIASKVPAYSGSVRVGATGFLARNAKDWLKHLRTLIEQPDVRSRMGAEARKWAESRVISRQIGLWLDAYELDR
jgi:glycosyltransferase involved in cell wall biosynthesis